MKLFWRIAIEFLIQFDNIRVGGIPRVPITCAIKAAQQLAVHFLMLGSTVKRSFRHAIHCACYLARSMEQKRQVTRILKDGTRYEMAAYHEFGRSEG